MEVNVKMNLKGIWLAVGPAGRLLEPGNGAWIFIKGGVFFDKLNNCKLLTEDSAP
jgi:hypothetical protein